VLSSLKDIALNLDQKSGVVRNEVQSIYKKIYILDFSFMIILWTLILERFDAVNKNLQCINMIYQVLWNCKNLIKFMYKI